MAYSTQTPPAGQLGKTRLITFLQVVAMVLRTGVRMRGQHGRIHGCVRATFEVLDNIPTKYKVGIFARPGTYQAAIRFSSGPQANDTIPGAQGMAIKLIGVPGHKILKSQADAVTHDFILLDFPVFFVRETDSYARLVTELAKLKPGAEPEKWLEWLNQSHPEDVAIAKRYDARVVDHPLTQSFYSQVPYAFGLGDDTICRYAALPHPENKNPSPTPPSSDGNHLRQAMIDHLTNAAQPATFDFCVQLLTGATPADVDSPTVEWSTPYQRVATITVMAQDFAQPDQDRFGQSLSYTPWHALPEHRPVGQINQIRLMVYTWSSRVRHFFNLSPFQKEPTSAIPPRPTGSCLGRVVKYTALAAAVSIAVIGWFLWPKLHVDLPTYPAVEKHVWLDQQWQPGAREWYHHASQGGQFPPMINVPYEWFIALEQPVISLGAAGLLADQRYLDRFGYIPSTTESGAFAWSSCTEPDSSKGYESGKELLSRRHRLPVGFACSDRHKDPMLSPDGKPWRHPATGETMGKLGLTCAACHTGRFTYGNTEFLVDGGSAMTDVIKLNSAIALALVYTKVDFLRFNRFALRLLGPDANNETARSALHAQLNQVVGRVFTLQKLDGKANPNGDTEGYGRLDALNRIGNQVFAIDLDKPENYVGSTAPVHYPRIWDVPWFAWAQYNGSIRQPMVRNAGEAFGTGTPIVLTGDPALTAPQFSSSVQVHTLVKMEDQLAGTEPNATGGKKGFTGLVAPKWPADVLGAIDPKLAGQGAKLYNDICAHCHLPQVGTEAFWNSKNWLNKDGVKQPYLDVNLIPVEEVGTDRSHVDDLAARRVSLPPDLKLSSDSFAEALRDVVGRAVKRWYETQTPPVPDKQQDEMNGHRLNEVAANLSYKSRPLDGIWATPPYLHNGSVPNIDLLLSPLADRPKKFWLGHREYDPKHLGYVYDKLPGGFEFDTSKRGNYNIGHLFDDAPADGAKMPGRIGPKLSPDDRRALIEFLKTL
ncbi:MAG: catalase family protein [Enhydrobacter sp.]